MRLRLALALLALPGAASAQVCGLTDAARSLVPAEPPEGFGYETTPPAPYWETDLGVGHMQRAPEELFGPPGDGSWVQQVELPLSEAPGSAPSAWLAHGWIVRPQAAAEALTLAAMLETGYEEVSFIVFEQRDAWLRIRYGGDEQSPESAWIPECALTAGTIGLVFAPWSEWLLSDEISPLFVRDGLPLALHAEPSETSATVASITNQDALEPHEVRGAWMRVTLEQPSDYCELDSTSTSHEGWVRWLGDDLGPRLWYFTRGC